jgi:hypothetical protein
MDATLVTAWKDLCQRLAPAFTEPTFVTFVHIATGWVLCRSKPTVTHLVCTIGESLLGHVAKHWTVYEEFFYRSVWDLREVSRLLLVEVVAPLIQTCGVQPVVDLAVDDTTCGRCGRHVAFAGYFKDASVSNTLKTVVHWSHNWVVGAVMLRSNRWPNWVIALPVWFTLYRKRPACNRRQPFRTRQQIAAEMIHQTRKALADWPLRVVGDGQYATKEVVEATAGAQSNLVSRIRSDAALYALPPKRRPRQRGATHKKGKRLPTPRQLASRRKKGWRSVKARIYGKVRQRLVLSIECLWYHVSRGRPIQLLIVRDPAGKERDDYLFCTDPTVSPVEILERFAGRWPIEESFLEGKQLGGMEKVQGWCPRTVLRQAPMALVVQTLAKAWYLLYGVKATAAQPQGTDWQRPRDHPSPLHMLATLRTVLWTARINGNSTLMARVRGFWKTLQFALCDAA